ncbi:hypothetical protein [Pseudocolwellia sp. HL-MZ7]|uniref:hypothetical protein n=1 Tax=Pseudocolwellia sp. HL-MZ7 TaxID=3400627 RepID=UPI003CEF0C87
MSKFYKFLLLILNSWVSLIFVILFSLASFYLAQVTKDTNLFAASGAVVTVFGLFSMIRFTTIERYINQEQIIAASTGVTGPPLTPEESERYQRDYQAAVKIQLKKELNSELKGISLTITGTLIWAYGSYIPLYLS